MFIITTMFRSIIITIMNMEKSVDAAMTTTTMIMTMRNTSIIITIMQMKCLQAGAKKHLRNIIRKNWIRSYRNYPKMTAMV